MSWAWRPASSVTTHLRSDQCRLRWAPVGRAGRRRLLVAGDPLPDAADVLLGGAGDPDRVHDRGEHEAEAGDEGVVLAHVQRPVEERVDEAKRSEQPGHESAGDAGDATEVGDGEQREADG